MKKPHVQTVGVTPVRSTTNVKELNVRLQGKPALTKDQTAVNAIQQVSKHGGLATVCGTA